VGSGRGKKVYSNIIYIYKRCLSGRLLVCGGLTEHIFLNAFFPKNSAWIGRYFQAKPRPGSKALWGKAQMISPSRVRE